jgi:superfamily II DNA or RNA helicase
MIKINTISPTKTIIEKASPEELVDLRAALTFKDTSVAFNLKKLKENRWLQSNYPDTFRKRKQELEGQLSTCMLKKDNGKFWFHPGSLPYIRGLDFDQNVSLEYPESRKVAWRKTLPFELYPYQKESVEGLIAAKHGCVELCTGAGKTAIILTLARELGLKTVIVTPSKSIFLEMLKKFEYHFGKNNVGAYGAGKKRIGKKFTVCVSKSLTMLKEGTDEYEFFATADVVISDESHLNAANTLEATFHGVLKDVPYRFFLSGTQVRGDGKDKLLEAIIGQKVHELSTKEAVDGGYICPVKFFVFETTSKNVKKYKDPLKSKREQFLYNSNIADIAAKVANGAWNYSQESTLILVEELEQIKMLTDRLTVPYEYVHSAAKKDAARFGLETRKVDQAVESFNHGEVKVLIGTSCIATGTNIYPTHNTVNWVGGSSEVRTKQGAVGRSVRILENSDYADLHKSKPFSKIYDFKITNVPLMEKHLQKRIAMYKETNDDIKYIKVN